MSSTSGSPQPPTPPVLPRPGQPVGTKHVVDATRWTLQSYLEPWRLHYGLPSLVGWTAVPTMDALEQASLPAGRIACPGLTDSPTRHATGYTGTYRVGIGVYVREDGYDAVQDAAGLWALALRQTVLGHPSLGFARGMVEVLTWLGEDVSVRPNSQTSRTLGGCAVAFDLRIKDVAPLRAQPSVPGEPDPSDPVMRQADLDVRVVLPTDPLEGSL